MNPPPVTNAFGPAQLFVAHVMSACACATARLSPAAGNVTVRAASEVVDIVRAARGRGGGRVAEHRRLVIDLGRPAEALRCRQTDRAALGGAVFAVDADEWSETKQASLESGGLTAEGRRRRRGARRRGGQPEGGGEKQGHADLHAGSAPADVLPVHC